MKETGLMFKAPLVPAILEGRKTQTRRVVKGVGHDNCIALRKPSKTKAGVFTHAMDAPKLGLCPCGKPGDRIYVRETWNWFDPKAIPAERAGQRAPFTGCQGSRQIPWVTAYAADGPLPHPGYCGKEHWRPNIHMPKWAARIWLEVTGVRVERLQDISEKDAIAEGIERTEDFFGCPCWRDYSEPEGPDASVCPDDPIGSFQTLWESTGGDWAANPWVWAIDFKVLSTTGRPA